jgi:hypothetical protein
MRLSSDEGWVQRLDVERGNIRTAPRDVLVFARTIR